MSGPLGRFLVFGFVCVLIGCGPSNQTPSNSTNNDLEQGRALYTKYCSACHGQDLEGRPPVNPSLKQLGNRRSKSFVRRRIKDGKGRMPSFSHLDKQSRDLVVEYLFQTTAEDTKPVQANNKADTASDPSQHRHQRRHRHGME